MSQFITRATRLRGAPLPTAAPAPEAKSVPVFSPAAQLFFGIADGQVDDAPLRGLATYAVSSLAYLCMAFRATKLVEAPLWIADEERGGDEAWLAGTHPLETLLEQPNADMRMGQLLQLVSLYLDAPGGGACLLVKNRDRAGRVASLYPFSRDEFTVERANGRLFGQFTIYTTTGPRTLGPEDVIYLYDTDPRNPWSALSPGDAALADLNLGENLRRAVQAAFRNTINPGATVETTEAIGEEEFQRLKAEITAGYAGVQNFGKVMLLEAGKLNQLKSNLKELDLGPLMLHVESTVCGVFGVHPVLLGLQSAAKLNGGLADSIKPAETVFYDRVAFPRWQQISEALTLGLLREVERSKPRRFIRFVTDRVRALQGDMQAKVTTAATATFWTTNEKRAFTGKKATGDPLDDTLQRAPKPPAAPGATAPDDEPDDAAETAKAARRPARKAWTDAEREAHAAAFDTRVESLLDIYAGAAETQFAADRRAVAALLDELVPAAGKARKDAADDEAVLAEIRRRLEANYAPGGAYHTEWLARYQALLAETFTAAGTQFAATYGVSFSIRSPGVRVAVQRRAAALASHVGETTASAITDVVTAGREAGLTTRQIAERINADVFGSEAKRRATVIANTEVPGALNEAEYVAAVDSEVMQSKEWLSRGDGSRVRPSHRIDGQKVALEDRFTNGLLHPGEEGAPAKEVVLCRCTCLYSDEEAA